MTDKEVLFRYRLKEAEETLEDAKKMLQSDVTPRSIMNRAYYAMFYVVLALFLNEDVSIKGPNISGLSQYLIRNLYIQARLIRTIRRFFISCLTHDRRATTRNL